MFTHLNYYNKIFKSLVESTSVTRHFCVYAKNAFLTVQRNEVDKYISCVHLEPTTNLSANALFTPYFEDHDPTNKTYYIPPFNVLNEYVNNAGGVENYIKSVESRNFLLQTYNNIFMKRGADVEEFLSTLNISLNDYSKYAVTSENIDDEDIQKFYNGFNIRSKYYGLAPSIELFSITNEDFMAEMDVMNSITTSMQNKKTDLYIMMDNFQSTKIYTELQNYSNVIEISDKLFKIEASGVFDELILKTKNKDIVKTYLNRTLDGEVFEFLNYTDVISKLA